MTDPTRDQRLRAWLERQQLAAVMLWRPDELVLATAHLPHWNASLCLYPARGEPVVYAPAGEPEPTLREGVRLRRYGTGGGDPMDALAEMVKADLHAAGKGPLGLVREARQTAPAGNPAESSPLPLGLADRLASLAGGGARDVSEMFGALYVHKTEAEIERIRRANQVADLGLRAFYAQLSSQRTEAEVAAAVEAAILSRTGRDGVGVARGWAMVQSGPNAMDGGTFNRNTGRRLGDGELVMIELATCVDGYWSDLTRTGAVGQPGAEPTRAYEAVREAQRAAFAEARPGARCADVHRAARRVIEQAGFGELFPHPTGHHVGFRYHDPGPALAEGVTDELAPGMVVTVEPGVYGEPLGTGTRTEDNVLITDTGCEVLSAAPRCLHGEDER